MKIVETRTPLDEEFEDCLNRFYDELFAINQKAVAQEKATGEEDSVKGQSCYLLEFINCNILKMSGKPKGEKGNRR